jgi:DNA-binding IclR family transcriptional regulator
LNADAEGGAVAGGARIPGESVAGKVFALLDAFAGDRTELTLGELCRATGLPGSTAHRLVGQLVRWGGLERTPEGSYRVGIHLWEIATRSPSSQGLREIAMPYLQDLYDVTKEHVQLAVPDGTEALLVEKISERSAVDTVGRAGDRLPLHASAVGKAILAFADVETQENALRVPLDAYTARTITSGVRLRAELAHVRRVGFALSEEELTVGAVSCAAPVLDAQGGVVAAVSVVVAGGMGVASGWAGAVRTAATGISRRLRSDLSLQPLRARRALLGRPTPPSH